MTHLIRKKFFIFAIAFLLTIVGYFYFDEIKKIILNRENKVFGIDGMSSGVFFLNFLYSLIATVVGGVVLAIFFFLTKEKIFPLPKINGCWYFEIVTNATKYKPFEGMILRYVVVLWQEGPYIKGTLEKIFENSSTREKDLDGKQRRRGVISGFLEKNYLSEDKVVLHVIEDGDGREYTNFYSLVVESDEKMTGTFSSTSAGQSGSSRWQRTEF